MKNVIGAIQFGLAIAEGLYKTWTILIGWSWFVTPLFGILVPDFWGLYGILLVASLLKSRFIPPADWFILMDAREGDPKKFEERNNSRGWADLGLQYLFTTYTLFAMWVVQHFLF